MSLKISDTAGSQSHFNWIAVLYGAILATISTIILLAIGGTVLYYTVYNEQIIPVLGLGILSASVFVGGLASARKAGRMGWLHGLSVGLLFLIITALFSMAVPGGVFGFAVFKKVVASTVAGCLGGIWGVGQS